MKKIECVRGNWGVRVS